MLVPIFCLKPTFGTFRRHPAALILSGSIAALVGSHSAQANTTNNFFQNSSMTAATNYSLGVLPTTTNDVVLTTASLTPNINASTALVFGSLDVINGSRQQRQDH